MKVHLRCKGCNVTKTRNMDIPEGIKIPTEFTCAECTGDKSGVYWEYRFKTPTERKKYVKGYFARNPNKAREHFMRRRARENGAKGIYTYELWIQKVIYWGYTCAYCGTSITLEKNKPNTVRCEHRIPLSRGGSNWIANLYPSCNSCNAKKHLSIWHLRGKYVDAIANTRVLPLAG